MKKILVFIFGCALTGCISIITPEISVVKQWEGHYYTVEEFNEKTKNIELEKDETIWVLSSRTLKRVLKNTAK